MNNVVDLYSVGKSVGLAGDTLTENTGKDQTTRIIMDKPTSQGEDSKEKETHNTLESLSMMSKSNTNSSFYDPNSIK